MISARVSYKHTVVVLQVIVCSRESADAGVVAVDTALPSESATDLRYHTGVRPELTPAEFRALRGLWSATGLNVRTLVGVPRRCYVEACNREQVWKTKA